ncbi:MAG: hypothetical protein KA116_00685 [Proteobacteria bacterium]|nr:hypothetical protein [Pseudomonadota bacterium]
MKSKIGFLFRALLPSWIFFDRFGYSPRLLYRLKTHQYEFGEWMECPKTKKRNLLNLFINPDGNLYLAKQTLLETLVNESQEISEKQSHNILNSSTYKLVCEWVRGLAKANDTLKHSFQFKIIAKLDAETDNSEEDVFISIEHAILNI